ncbi:hypothetical protein AB0C21_29370 [Spirillospora sp. NPDC049024]
MIMKRILAVVVLASGATLAGIAGLSATASASTGPDAIASATSYAQVMGGHGDHHGHHHGHHHDCDENTNTNININING